jgi:hypothetical protein
MGMGITVSIMAKKTRKSSILVLRFITHNGWRLFRYDITLHVGLIVDFGELIENPVHQTFFVFQIFSGIGVFIVANFLAKFIPPIFQDPIEKRGFPFFELEFHHGDLLILRFERETSVKKAALYKSSLKQILRYRKRKNEGSWSKGSHGNTKMNILIQGRSQGEGD